MATYVLTIGGVEKSIKLDTLRITETANGRNTMAFAVESNDGSYRPARGAEVLFTEDGTRIFGGLVTDVKESGQGNIGGTPIVNAITAQDFNSYADRRFITVTIAAGTLKAALQVLDDYLADYGVTLDGAQVTGPDVPELIYQFKKLSDVFNELAELTGYTWDIDYNKVLRMTLPASTSAPFNLIADDGKVIGDLTVEYSLADYANRVTVRFTDDAIEAWAFISPTSISNGETVTIGSTTYTFQTVLVDEANNVLIGGSIDETLTNLAAAMEAAESSGQGTLFGTETDQNSAAYGFILRTGMFNVKARTPGENGNSIALAETFANGSWYWEGNMATSTMLGGADEALTDFVEVNDLTEQGLMELWESVVDAADVRDYPKALELANAYLAKAVAAKTFKRATYTTEEDGVHPGQTQTITLPTRGLSGTYLLTDVEIFETSNWVRRRVTVQGGTTLANRWQDDAKRALSSGSSSGASIGAVVGGGGGSIIVGGVLPTYFGGGEDIRTRITTASTWYRGRNGGEIILDSYTLTPTVRMSLLMIADAVTGGNAQCRVVAGSGNWSDQTVVSGTVTPVTDGADWVWQEVTITLRAGVWAYRIEMSSSVNLSDVGFRAYLLP